MNYHSAQVFESDGWPQLPRIGTIVKVQYNPDPSVILESYHKATLGGKGGGKVVILDLTGRCECYEMPLSAFRNDVGITDHSISASAAWALYFEVQVNGKISSESISKYLKGIINDR